MFCCVEFCPCLCLVVRLQFCHSCLCKPVRISVTRVSSCFGVLAIRSFFVVVACCPSLSNLVRELSNLFTWFSNLNFCETCWQFVNLERTYNNLEFVEFLDHNLEVLDNLLESSWRILKFLKVSCAIELAEHKSGKTIIHSVKALCCICLLQVKKKGNKTETKKKEKEGSVGKTKQERKKRKAIELWEGNFWFAQYYLE